MAIIVVCQKCRTRFKVSEQFAGRKGPCPKCKTVITIPKADEQVKIHTPEHSEAGARGRGGELILKPIAREEVKVSWWVLGAIGVACLAVLITAFSLRGAELATKKWMATIGLIVLAPPLCIAAYTFLRDDELEPYSGLALWIRTAICASLYAASWGAFVMIPPTWYDELYKWAFLGPAFGVAGATVSFACFDLDFGSGFFHYAFYVGITMMLAYAMGLSVIG